MGARVIRVVIVIALAALIGFGVYSGTQVMAQRETPATAAPVAISPPAIMADAYILPVRQAALSVATAGRITEVHVTEGQAVKQGDPLITLDAGIQQQALAQAEANVAAAEARLAQLRAGARAEEISQAGAAVQAAQARLDRLAAGPTAEQVAIARQGVAVAQANVEKAAAGAKRQDLTAAGATLAQAEAALKQAQAAYDRISFRDDRGALPESLRLEQATNEYQRAQASYQIVVNGPTETDLRVLRQQVAQAQASLDEVMAGAHPADLAAAQAEVARAQAALGLLKSGARAEEIAAAEAQLAVTKAAAEQARIALAQTQLRAPFAGLIGALPANPGEYVTPGTPIVRIGDTSRWVAETDNLTEQDVVKLDTGAKVEVTIDALPGQTLEGTVTAIQPASDIKRGDVTYKVTIALEPGELPLRWGLTAAITGR